MCYVRELCVHIVICQIPARDVTPSVIVVAISIIAEMSGWSGCNLPFISH